ncbi:Mitochondrial import inner membrane translocase [Paragonimus heterotremus]|uniref:Mitochondrial import inner membrane translocase n=1 Tax=Paragonimus heterotremus TaxID=100268 RepID=A0A8J4TBY5_9TREM|nr:Mitochondrial import inner membrane translocase [Paragonimus heterotremus]
MYPSLLRKYERHLYIVSFIQSLIDKVKEESHRDIELKESIRKFREETAKLERSAELQSVREFYKKIEKELPADTVEKVRDKLQFVEERLREKRQQFAMNESIKRSLDSLSRAGEQVKDVTRSLGDTELLKAAKKVGVRFTTNVKQGVEAMDNELQSDRSKMYQPPRVLKTRNEVVGITEERTIKPDSESSGVVLHKDSKWYGAWQDFKDTNQYVQKFFDLKAQYRESEHLFARSMRFVTDRLSNIFGGLGKDNELQVVLDEIMKVDSNFDTESFLRFCRFLVVPNVLEAIVRGDLKILKNWCHEAPYNVLAAPWNQIKELGLISESRVLDVHNVDVSYPSIISFLLNVNGV